MYKYNLNHVVFSIINIIINKLLESKWRPSSSRDSDSQSQVRHRLKQLFFINGFSRLIVRHRIFTFYGYITCTGVPPQAFHDSLLLAFLKLTRVSTILPYLQIHKLQ